MGKYEKSLAPLGQNKYQRKIAEGSRE